MGEDEGNEGEGGLIMDNQLLEPKTADSKQATNGPWELQKLFDNWHGYEGWKTFAIRSPGNICLAVVGEVDRASTSENEANARLMSAAPDMLHALEVIYSNAAESPEWIRSKISSVIAKAGGCCHRLGP